MGKIFDALEKAGKEPAKPDRSRKIDSPVRKKIVPLEKKGRDRAGSRHLKGKKSSPKLKPDLADTAIDGQLICALKPRSFEAEQFKMLRTKLLFPAEGEAPRTIMVTSGVPGEGKSFVAANLAVSIAQNINKHVLLMDCDLRMPSLGQTFGIETTAGLSEYLADGLTIPDLLCKTVIDKLTILPAGQPPANPAELLSSEKMFDLLEDVKTRYQDRYVIIDLPPPNLTSEAHAIARRVDGIILVIRQGMSSRKIIAGLVDMLGERKILGVVFNGVDTQSFGYGGYGKYGKYGDYSYGKE